MSYTTLTGLKTVEGSIRNWVNDGTVPASVVLTEAEQFIYTRLRVREMRQLTEGTIADGDTSLTLATVAPRYLEMITFNRAGDSKGIIRYFDEEQFEQRFVTDNLGNEYEGVPTECTVDGTTIRFNTEADQAYLYRLWYYARPEPLSVSNETNFLIEKHPKLIRHACLAHAYDFKKDMQSRDWHMKAAEMEIFEANKLVDIENQSQEVNKYWDNM